MKLKYTKKNSDQVLEASGATVEEFITSLGLTQEENDLMRAELPPQPCFEDVALYVMVVLKGDIIDLEFDERQRRVYKTGDAEQLGRLMGTEIRVEPSQGWVKVSFCDRMYY